MPFPSRQLPGLGAIRVMDMVQHHPKTHGRLQLAETDSFS
jgi:hypothetical protein